MSRDTDFDVIVVGAGHAGCEAALAAARLGCRTLLATMQLESIAQMSCNPAVGGTAKGILTREIDALGGVQGLLTDQSGIQFRMLNRSRGPAVQAPRAQCDKRLYALLMKQYLERAPNLTLRQELVEELRLAPVAGAAHAELERYRERHARLLNGAAPAELPIAPPAPGALRVSGVRGSSGLWYSAKTVVLTTGTFLRGLIHQGPQISRGGRSGEPAAMNLSLSLEALGFELRRLKTGTPPRLNGRTVNKAALAEQWGDEPPPAFSFRTVRIERPQLPCWLTRTTARTHELIRANLHQAPLFTGQIKARGPRYCPSIEDKVVRFAQKESHQVFLEPEGTQTEELYANGLATSLPPAVQLDIVRSLPGCAEAEILRFGYAIEYDMASPEQIGLTLETRRAPGLFLAGQINGTSGYEEAAGQGLLAGINAGLCTRGEPPLILGRHEAYLGVMIDDLVTKEITEPYRLFTSRSEYRLLLRQDNADRRLAPHARRLGLLDAPALEAAAAKEAAVASAAELMRVARPGGEGKTWWELLRQPEMTLAELRRRGLELEAAPTDCSAGILSRRDWKPALQRADSVAEALEIEAKYEGYLRRQQEQVERLRELESRALPEQLDYAAVKGLGREATEKLSRHRPRTFGQALRIDGVTPADASLLAIHLAQHRV